MKIEEIIRSEDDTHIGLMVKHNRKLVSVLGLLDFSVTGLNQIICVVEMSDGVYELSFTKELRRHRILIVENGITKAEITCH